MPHVRVIARCADISSIAHALARTLLNPVLHAVYLGILRQPYRSHFGAKQSIVPHRLSAPAHGRKMYLMRRLIAATALALALARPAATVRCE